MNELTVNTSYHAIHRIRERLGVNKKGAERLIIKAWHDGMERKQIVGNLAKWVDVYTSKNNTIARIYNGALFLFADSPNGVVAVTTFVVPGILAKATHAQCKQQRSIAAAAA